MTRQAGLEAVLAAVEDEMSRQAVLNAVRVDRSYLEKFASSLREAIVPQGCSAMGTCGDAAAAAFDLLRRKVHDIEVCYGSLAWDGHEPVAHWWAQSPSLGLIVDAANPYTDKGFVTATSDARYACTKARPLTRRERQELRYGMYYGLDLNRDYFLQGEFLDEGEP